MGRPRRGVNGGGVAEKEARMNIKIKTVKRSIGEEAGRRNNACPMRNWSHEQGGRTKARISIPPLLVHRTLKSEDHQVQ
jgi:hypothetical protein